MADTKTGNIAQVQHDEGKGEIQMLEIDRTLSPELAMKGGALQDAEARGQQESGYESLGAWATIKKFRRTAMYMFFVTFAAATDGYQVSSFRIIRRFSKACIDLHQRQYHCELGIPTAIRNHRQL